MVWFIQEIRNLLGNIRYGWQERKTPYIDNKVLNKRCIENRDLYNKKIDNAFAHLKNNDLTQALYEKFIADEYLDTAHLWEKKSRLTKYINDNRDHVKGALIGMFSDYVTSLGQLEELPSQHLQFIQMVLIFFQISFSLGLLLFPGLHLSLEWSIKRD